MRRSVFRIAPRRTDLPVRLDRAFCAADQDDGPGGPSSFKPGLTQGQALHFRPPLPPLKLNLNSSAASKTR
ncbi:hypothetical protein RAHE111665_17495 [Rariglobus hedericola]